MSLKNMLTLLTIAIKFVSSKGSDETRIMHSKSDIAEIIINGETDEIIEELFESLLQGYQEGLEEKMKGKEFLLMVLYYNLNKINPVRGESYIDSPKWLKNKKSNNKS